MKKRMLCVVVLAMLSGGVFAQFNFSGGAYTGVGIVAQDDNVPSSTDGPAPYYVMSSQTHAPYRAFLNGDYTNADQTMGFSVALQAAPPSGNPNYATTEEPLYVPFSTAAGWAKLFDLLTVRGGYNVANPAFGFGRDSYMIARAGSGDDTDQQSTAIEPGVVAVLTPFEGFSFGGSLKPTPRSRDAAYEAGITYTVPRLATFTATWLRDTRESATTGRGSSPDGITALTLGLRSVGIPNLNFAIAAKLDKLHDFKDTGTVLLVDYIYYTRGNVRIGFDTNQQILMPEKATTGAGTFDGEPFSFLVQPYVTYNFGKVSPRLDLAYIHNGTVYGATLWTYDIGSLTNVKGDYAFVIQPSVSYRPTSGFTINAGYKFSYSKSDQITGNNRTLSLVYVDFVYRFVATGGSSSSGGNPNYPGGGGNPNFPGGGGNPNYR
ncbi:MAG: porin family protein [Spirochaetaceae bacterium]|nr:porin family protein [Spirochaetaceae bacterium]